MVVEVVHPDPDRVPAILLTGIGAGVENLVGQQSVVPLDLAVVPGRIGLDALVPAGEGLHAPGEVAGLVVGAVVRDDSVDPLDPVGRKRTPGLGRRIRSSSPPSHRPEPRCRPASRSRPRPSAGRCSRSSLRDRAWPPSPQHCRGHGPASRRRRGCARPSSHPGGPCARARRRGSVPGSCGSSRLRGSDRAGERSRAGPATVRRCAG